MRKILPFLFGLFPFACFAQFSISGRVLNQSTTKPVSNASIFISNTSIGTETGADGTFVLNDIKPGKYDLIVSYVGFENYDQTIVINNSNVKLADIIIFPKTILLNQVTVKSKDDPEREKYYQWFKDEFIGTTDLAKDCKITNSEAIDFDYDEKTGILKASASSPLVIVNKALGYKLTYLLHSFTLNHQDEGNKIFDYSGYVLFAELKGSRSEEREWKKKRAGVYEGSQIHFLQSALKDQLDQEGFRVLRLTSFDNPNRPVDSIINAKIAHFKALKNERSSKDSLTYWEKKSRIPKVYQKIIQKPLSKDEIITSISGSGIFKFGYSGDPLLISYDKYRHFSGAFTDNLSSPANTSNTLVSFNTSSVYFDTNGSLIDPHDLSYDGAWLRNRIAGLLPLDYNPNVANDNTSAYTAFIKTLTSALKNFFTMHRPEKAYLHFDKPMYAAGDTLYFKAYVTEAVQHKLSEVSAVLYVDLITPENIITKTEKLELADGISWGDFILPDTLKEGNYRIRAYTNWMKNDGEDYFFDRTIKIGNALNNGIFTKTDYTYSSSNGKQQVIGAIKYTSLNGTPYAGKPVSYKVEVKGKGIATGKGITDESGVLKINFNNTDSGPGQIITNIKLTDGRSISKVIPLKTLSDKADIQFFPEGGELVNGAQSKIAFKAVGPDGLGTEVEGIVRDENGTEITSFNSQHLGMGTFSFTPQDGKAYKAEVTYADGTSSTVKLPAATNKGFSLSIDNNRKDSVIVKLFAGNEALVKPAFLIVQSGESINYLVQAKAGSQNMNVLVPRKVLNPGIARFTLFTADGEPLNERLVFIEPTDNLNLTIATEKAGYGPRQKVKINIDASNKAHLPVSGNFSVAVTNEDQPAVNEDEENNIISNLFLTSDLKGYIEKPNYYFNHTSNKTRADMDILMLTQGFHRFEWKKLLNNGNQILSHQAESSLTISGRVKSTSGKTVANAKITLFGKASGILLDTLTNVEGKFVFDHLTFPDTAKFLVQARTEKDGRNLQIEIDSIQSVPVITKSFPVATENEKGLTSFLETSKQAYNNKLKYGISKKSNVLKEVKIKGKKEEVISYSDNLNGKGNADFIVTAKEIEKWHCQFIIQCLKNRFPSIYFYNAQAYNKRSDHGVNGITPMAIYIDGIISDFKSNSFSLLHPDNIQSIEILMGPHYGAAYGGPGQNGAIIITTKRGSSTPAEVTSPGVLTFISRGYYKARQFYMPKYDNPKTNTIIPDLRSTIYWKPDLVTNKDGKATLEYFNADTKGNYRIVIEGVDNEGRLGRKVYHYEVN